MSLVVIVLLMVIALVAAGFLATIRRGAVNDAGPSMELGAEERSRLIRLRKIATSIEELKASATAGSTAAIVAAEAQTEAAHVVEEANRLLAARRIARTAVKHGATADAVTQIDARLDVAESTLDTLRTELAKAVAEPNATMSEGLEDRLGQLKALNETLRELKA